MIWLEKTSVMNFENAMRGARNPLNSWHYSDSKTEPDGSFHFGEKDLDLAKRLCAAGSDHRKFLRQIFVSVDITAPLYWWKEFDTYKVGTVANSTSTMHKLASSPLTRENFSIDFLDDDGLRMLDFLISYLEDLRTRYLKTKEKHDWEQMIALLPESYLQLRTCTLNYENLRGMYRARKEHKLREWRTFCQWVERLPYSSALITGEERE